MKPVFCKYCDQPARLVKGDAIYPHRPDLFKLSFWQCVPCEAFVGCHRQGVGHGDGTRPLGTLANAELREARKEAHARFDPLWGKGQGKMSRGQAYRWLSLALFLPVDKCHISMMNVAQCKAVVAAVTKVFAANLQDQHGNP